MATTVLSQGARNPVTGFAAYGGAQAFGDGVHDDTQALRDALTLGRGATTTPVQNNWNNVVVYLPPGTYKLSSILILRRPFVFFGEPSARPKLQLEANCPFFASGANPFIIPDSGWNHAYNDYTTWNIRGTGPTGTFSSTNDDYDENFQDIDVEVLSGNPGCQLGVCWCGAQGIEYRNSVITVTASQLAAIQWGVIVAPGSNDGGSGGGIVANITTNGGQSAMIQAGGSYAVWRGCTFNGAVTLNGGNVGQNTLIACTINNPGGTGFNNNFGPFTMDDCVLTTGTPFTRQGNHWHIENSGGIAQETQGNVWLNNVSVSGAASNASLSVAGVVKGSPYANPAYPYAPANTVNITAAPYNAVSGQDCTAAIKSALSVAGASIYFPPGTYIISSSVTIGANQSWYGNSVSSCSIVLTNGAIVAVNTGGLSAGPAILVALSITADVSNQIMTWDADPRSMMIDVQLHPTNAGTGPICAFRSGGGFIEQGSWPADGNPGMQQGPTITSTTGPFYFYALSPEHYSVVGWVMTNAQNVFIRPLDFEIIQSTGNCITISGGNNINISGAIAGFPSSGPSSYIATLTNNPKVSLWVPYIYNAGCRGVVLEAGTAGDGSGGAGVYGSGAAGTILPGYIHPSTVSNLVPSVSFSAATNVTQTSATLNGIVTAAGTSSVTGDGFHYGTTTAYGTTTNATTVQSGAISANITGLSSNTTYDIQVFATNTTGTGTATGTFTTLSAPVIPTVIAPGASVGSGVATLNGNISSNGGDPILSDGFDWGPTTAYGTHVSGTTIVQSGAFNSAQITGLTNGTTYHFRATATNAAGTGVSGDIQFTPSATAAVPTLVQHASSASNNNVNYGSNGPVNVGSPFHFNLPNPSLAGNALILEVSGRINTAPTVTDNVGTNAWTLVNEANDGTTRTSVFVATNVAAGTQRFTITFTAPCFNGHFACSEFNNVSTVYGSSALHTTGTANLSAGSSITGVVAGDLVWMAGRDTQNATGLSNATNIAAGAGFSLLSADVFNGTVSEYSFTVSGTVTPTATLSNSTDAFNCVAVALHSVAQGSPAPSGMRIMRTQGVFYNRATAMQFPSTGNMLYFTTTFDNATLSPISFPAGWNNVGYTTVQGFYASNLNSPNLSFTVNGATAGALTFTQATIYDVAGASSTPFNNFTSTGSIIFNIPPTVGNEVGGTVTVPGNGLAIFTVAIGTGNIGAGASGVPLCMTDTCSYGSAPGTPGGTNGNAWGGDTMDSADGYGHMYNTSSSAAPFTFTWGYLSNGNGLSPNQEEIFGMSVAFNAGAVSPVVPTVNPGSSSNVLATTVTLNGSISSNGNATITQDGFKYGAAGGASGTYGTTAPAATVQSGAISVNLVGLTANSTYHYITFATNSAGTGQTTDQTFTTSSSSVSPYVQGTMTVGGTSGLITTLSLAFTSAQTATNTNVVALTFHSTTVTASVSDSNGAYAIASPLTASPGGDSQVIFWRANIAGGANTVTATLTGAGAQFVGLRIAEYSGIAFIDVFSQQGGTGATASVPPFTTSNASDVIVAALVNDAAGIQSFASGFIEELSGSSLGFGGIDFQDSKPNTIVSNATVPTVLAASANWVENVVAFSPSVVTGIPTLSVSAATTGSTTATLNGSITSNGNQTITADGFDWGTTISYGTHVNVTPPVQIGSFTSNISGLSPGVTYHYRSTAQNASGTGFSVDQQFSTTSVGTVYSLVNHFYVNSASVTGSTLTFAPTWVQTAGDILIVAIGYTSGSATVTVSDTANGAYSTAIGPTVDSTGGQTQYVFYRSNIAAANSGTNTITCNFSAPSLLFPDMRVSEFSSTIGKTWNVNQSVGLAAPSATTDTSGNMISTTVSNALIYGAGYTSDGFSAAGPGFNQIDITSNGNIHEYQVVTSVGVYAATGSDSAGGRVIMQAVAFVASAIPSVSVSAATVGPGTATLNGSISSNGNGTITADGFDWGTSISYGTHVVAATVQSGAFTSNLSGLTNGTTYHYRSTAVNSSGTGVSGDSQFTPAATVAVPTVTASGATAIGSGIATLNGAISSNGNATITSDGFKYGAAGGASGIYGTTVNASTVQSGAISVNLVGLTANSTYHYIVFAINSAGTGQTTDQTFTTNAVPAVPTGFSASTVSASSISINWTVPVTQVDPNYTNIQITYPVDHMGGEFSSFTQFGIAPGVVSGSDSLIDSGLQHPGTTYSYRMRALDPANNFSGYTSTFTGLTASSDITVPTVPGTPSLSSVTNNSITVNWATSTDTQEPSSSLTYTLQRSTNGGSFIQIATNIPGVSSGNVTYPDGGLTPLNQYAYKVQAINPANLSGSNSSGFSTPSITITTLPTPPFFVQGNSSSASSVTSATCSFTSSQTAGDGNLLVISTSSASAINILSPVTDQAGHTYTLIDGPTTVGSAPILTQWIYFSNI